MMPAMLALSLILGAGAQAPEGEVGLRLDLSRDQARGQADAPVLVAEFSDFRCPACEKFSLTIMPNLSKEFIEPGKVKVVFVDFPMVGDASYTTVFESVHCAGKQGKYWQMHEKLFGHQQALSAADLARYAQEAGVEPGAFKKCVDADAHGAKIRKDLADAQAAGITGTPTFFLGFAESGGKVKVVRRIQGAQPYPVFKAAIDGLLAEGAKK